MKTNKSFLKRLRVTKNGKILSRATGQNHYNAKESGRKQTAKGRSVPFKMTSRQKRQFLSNAR